ncbi:MAG: PfkB family carbohydrate kinase, partial [Candidatus Nanohalobium sp.]
MGHMQSSALVIGQVTIDEYFDADGDYIASVPGGTGLNAALWFESNKFSTELAATLGSNFPELASLDFSSSERVDEECPVSEITLKDGGREEVQHIKGDYSLKELEGSGEYDMVYLTSGFQEYSKPYMDSEADIKAFSPGHEPGEISMENVRNCLEEADFVLMNGREESILEQNLGYPIRDLSDKMDIDYVLVTEKDKITSYSSGGVSELSVDTIEDPEDTIGAGDAFAANYLSSRLEGLNHEDAVQEGIARSREIVEQRGPLPSNPIR